jgi:nucleoid-associated protein YgaU
VPEEVVVAPGESFWSISSDALTEALGRTPQDLEITAHWRRLVAANRDRLVDPANPDLLYPGQTLVLPAP